jgi:hypothetical protein
MVHCLANGESLCEVDNLSLFSLWSAVDSELMARSEREEMTQLSPILVDDGLDLVDQLRMYGGM